MLQTLVVAATGKSRWTTVLRTSQFTPETGRREVLAIESQRPPHHRTENRDRCSRCETAAVQQHNYKCREGAQAKSGPASKARDRDRDCCIGATNTIDNLCQYRTFTQNCRKLRCSKGDHTAWVYMGLCYYRCPTMREAYDMHMETQTRDHDQVMDPETKNHNKFLGLEHGDLSD